MNITHAKPGSKSRLQTALTHVSGDRRCKILEVHMKKRQFRRDALITRVASIKGGRVRDNFFSLTTTPN